MPSKNAPRATRAGLLTLSAAVLSLSAALGGPYAVILAAIGSAGAGLTIWIAGRSDDSPVDTTAGPPALEPDARCRLLIHDLRNAMASMVAYTTEIHEHAPAGPADDALRNFERSAERASRLATRITQACAERKA